MLSEEKKAIERIEDTFYQDNGKGIKGFQKIILYEDGIIDILKLLNIVEKTTKENEEKDKQIDLMAEMIDELSEYYTRYNGKNNEFCKEICIKKDIDCIDCIKQYFETKAMKGE